jgi:hypothetical protein
MFEPDNMYEHRIVIGDWSHDGHNQEEYFTFKCSHDEQEIKKAYKEAVKKCRVALHDDHGRGKGITPVCCNYEERTIREPEVERLKELGVNLDFAKGMDDNGDLSCGPEDIARIFFEMVKTQIEGFTYELIPEKKTINGFWSKDFNYGFGYGTFS